MLLLTSPIPIIVIGPWNGSLIHALNAQHNQRPYIIVKWMVYYNYCGIKNKVRKPVERSRCFILTLISFTPRPDLSSYSCQISQTTHSHYTVLRIHTMLVRFDILWFDDSLSNYNLIIIMHTIAMLRQRTHGYQTTITTNIKWNMLCYFFRYLCSSLPRLSLLNWTQHWLQIIIENKSSLVCVHIIFYACKPKPQPKHVILHGYEWGFYLPLAWLTGAWSNCS